MFVEFQNKDILSKCNKNNSKQDVKVSFLLKKPI